MAGSPGAQPIITPEAVVLDFERAGVASRAIAFAIDALALGATVFALLLIVYLSMGDADTGGGAALVAVLTSLGMVIVWFTAFETLWRGRTLGKAAMGLRVVSADGTTVRFQQAFLRSAVGLVDFFLLPIGFIAVVTVLFSPRDQRLGDMAAGTLVVRERAASTYVAPAWFSAPPGWERYAASLDVAALDEESYGLVRSFLLRVNELTSGARDHLAVRLANPLAVRMGHVPPSYVHPHVFLVCVAAAWQQAHGGLAPKAPQGQSWAPAGGPATGAWSPQPGWQPQVSRAGWQPQASQQVSSGPEHPVQPPAAAPAPPPASAPPTGSWQRASSPPPPPPPPPPPSGGPPPPPPPQDGEPRAASPQDRPSPP